MTVDEARSLVAAALRPAIEANWPNHELAPIEWRYGRWSDEYRRASSGRTQAIEDATTAVIGCLREAGALEGTLAVEQAVWSAMSEARAHGPESPSAQVYRFLNELSAQGFRLAEERRA